MLAEIDGVSGNGQVCTHISALYQPSMYAWDGYIYPRLRYFGDFQCVSATKNPHVQVLEIRTFEFSGGFLVADMKAQYSKI